MWFWKHASPTSNVSMHKKRGIFWVFQCTAPRPPWHIGLPERIRSAVGSTTTGQAGQSRSHHCRTTWRLCRILQFAGQRCVIGVGGRWSIDCVLSSVLMIYGCLKLKHPETDQCAACIPRPVLLAIPSFRLAQHTAIRLQCGGCVKLDSAGLDGMRTRRGGGPTVHHMHGMSSWTAKLRL